MSRQDPRSQQRRRAQADLLLRPAGDRRLTFPLLVAAAREVDTASIGPIAQKMPLNELFAWASSPMALGAVAAVGVTALCYSRFKSLKLDERPAEPEGPGSNSVAESRAS